MNLIEALVQSGFINKSASDLTKKENHAVVRDAYDNMIAVLNYVFRTIPARADMPLAQSDFSEYEFQRNLEKEYNRFQDIVKKATSDFDMHPKS